MWKNAAAAIVAAALAAVPCVSRAQEAAPAAGMSPDMDHGENQHDMTGMDMSGMDMSAMTTPLDVPDERQGSGTSWLPDESTMNAVMRRARGWMLMAHGQLFLQYVDVSSDRGDRQAGSINWVMASASRSLAGGVLTMRTMLSAEPLTVGRCGYPDLVQSGESCRGLALHDRQHPHDLVMELGADYRRAVTSDLAVELYGAVAGEPALGPVAFPHRLSAMPNPIAPISHHWLDATHVSFGVATAGVHGRRWKAEGSAFNGREPDDARYDLDLATLNSYAGRFSWLPSRRWAFQVSAGRLRDVEEHDGEPVDVQRTTASATYHRIDGTRVWATTGAWGRNVEDGLATQAALIETSLGVTSRDTMFGRGEIVQKTARDMGVALDAHEVFAIAKVQAGYVRQVLARAGMDAGIGASVAVAALPAALGPSYSSRAPVEIAVFFMLRPTARSTHQQTLRMDHD